MTLNEIKVGEQFKFKGFTYTKLNDEGLVLLDDLKDPWYQECCFDNVNNCYEFSLIRHYINSTKFKKYLGLLDGDFSKKNFGYKRDKLFLLSVEECEEYHNYIKLFPESSWLRSGHYLYASNACSLYPSGASAYGNNVFGSRAVRPALYLNPSSKLFATSDCEV